MKLYNFDSVFICIDFVFGKCLLVWFAFSLQMLHGHTNYFFHHTFFLFSCVDC